MSRRTRSPFPRFCRLMKNRNGKERTRPWDTNKENIYGVFFVLFTHPSFLVYFDKQRHWQIKYGQFAASSAQKSANRLVKLQNYVPRSESRQAQSWFGRRILPSLYLERTCWSKEDQFLEIFWFYFRFYAEFENCFLAKMRLKVSRSFSFEWFIWFICPGTVVIIAFYCNFSLAW